MTTNAVLDPNGELTADRLEFNLNGGTTTNDRSLIRPFITTTIGESYTFSVWMKAVTGTPTVKLDFNGVGGGNFTLTSSWQRYSITLPSANATTRYPIIQLRGAQGTSDTAVVDMWNAELVAHGDATQTISTDQPLIYDVATESVITENGKPAIRFDALARFC